MEHGRALIENQEDQERGIETEQRRRRPRLEPIRILSGTQVTCQRSGQQRVEQRQSQRRALGSTRRLVSHSRRLG